MNFVRSPAFKRFLWETLLNIIFPWPYFEFRFSMDLLGLRINYEVQTFFYSLLYLKLYYLFRVIPLYSSFNDAKNIYELTTDEQGSDNQKIFIIKAILKERSVILILFGYILVMFVGGITLRMFEV